MKHALITGGAGFIGSHLSEQLLADGWQVTAIDNFDPFYPREAKERNIANCLQNSSYTLVEHDICNHRGLVKSLHDEYHCIIHLAAKAGIRPSIQDPMGYERVNIAGTQNMLEFARERQINQFLFASSSSVYGVNPNVPWREEDHVLNPISPYAATKIAGELLGHVYAHLYGIQFIALRFFTVYGPRQRPDLAIHKFAHLISSGTAVPVFGDGSSRRDYTYISDIIQGVRQAMKYEKTSYEVINLGNSCPTTLLHLVRLLEKSIGKEARIEHRPLQPGDVPQTFADTTKAKSLLGYSPTISIEEGLHRFSEWYLAEFYQQ